MAISAYNTYLERARQSIEHDDKFFKKMLMFFELWVPTEVSVYGETSFLFPLIPGVSSYGVDEPFTLEVTPTQGGGLYVEENGIVQRTIKISGTTGFKPRKLNASGPMALATVSPEKRSHGRILPAIALEAISGQRHLQYLQDAVFRTYADLKRDPNTAANTKLFFHIPKDDEHWLVVPQRFSLERSAAKATLYTYNIDLLVVDGGEFLDKTFTEDTWLDKVKDKIQSVKSAIDLAQGAINDLTAVVGEIKGYTKDIAVILDTATGVITAASNFVTGVVDLIESPLAIMNSVAEGIDAAAKFIDTLEQARDDIQKLPESTKQKIHQIGEAMERLMQHPDATAPSSNSAIKTIKRKTDGVGNISANARQAATTPASLSAVRRMGTGITAGDLLIADSQANVPKEQSATYRSGKQVTINAGDTLTNLAAQHLGDARRWQDLAIVNGLKPPFINSQASLDLTKADESVLPGVLGIGDKIVIPSTSKGPAQLPVLPVLGVKPWETLDVQLLGRDIALELVTSASRPGKPLYDIPIDVEHGSVDVKTISGVANLSQGLMNRLNTETGTDILYKRMGLNRVVGLNIAALDLETVRFRISQAILQDARIASVRKIVFEGLDNDTQVDPSIPLDAVIADITAEVRGFAQNANVRLPM